MIIKFLTYLSAFFYWHLTAFFDRNFNALFGGNLPAPDLRNLKEGEVIRSKNSRNQIKESAESDLRWYKSPWEWSYNAPWALVGNSREALDGKPYQSPGRQTLMKNEEKLFQSRLKFYKILARVPWCKRSDNPRCTWSLVPACKVRCKRRLHTSCAKVSAYSVPARHN